MSISVLPNRYGLIEKVALSCIPKKKSPVALTFHNILPSQKSWFIDVIDLIQEKYGFLSVENLPEAIQGKRTEHRVLLTFDDGFFSNRIVAEEVLAARQVKALFFVTRGFIGLRGQKALQFAKRQFFPSHVPGNIEMNHLDAMNWSDLRWLQEQGHKIGAHTEQHLRLSQLSQREKQSEIVKAANQLEQDIENPVRYFAYPFGSLSAIDLASYHFACQRFDLAFSNIRGSLSRSPSKHFIFRQNITPEMPLWFVEAVIDGKLDWRYHRTRRRAKAGYWSCVPIQ